MGVMLPSNGLLSKSNHLTIIIVMEMAIVIAIMQGQRMILLLLYHLFLKILRNLIMI